MTSEGAMDIDLPTEVSPTEETVDALLEYLVGPLLPLKHSDIASEKPSKGQQELVAKQVHAAAVLYNYFHLNHHKESQFLNFDQFCNLTIMFQPNILHHMKHMCQSNHSVLDENQLSLTEKAIIDACTISETLLNASGDISNVIKEWSINKVAVLLVDSKKEKCFLKFGNGVWSVIEKDLHPESKICTRTMIVYDEEVEAGFQKLAFLAVKEVTENVNAELKVLESHVVYSLSQAKTATLFYIVQSTQSISEVDMVPIQDAICSLQGPVVKESLGRWVVTPVVEYYYLLPYAEIISKWFSRISDSAPHHMEKRSADANIFQGSQKEVSADLQIKSKFDSESEHISNSSREEPPDSKFIKNISKSNDSSDDLISSWLGGFFNQEVNDRINSVDDRIMDFNQEVNEIISSTDDSIMDGSSDGTKEDMDTSCRVELNNLSSGTDHKSVKEGMDTSCRVELNNSSSGTDNKSVKEDINSSCRLEHNENIKDLKILSTISQSQSKDAMVDDENRPNMVSPNVDRIPTVNHALEGFHSTAKRSELSEVALRALLNKKQRLCNRQEVIEGELILCDKKIQAIMHGGIGDCLGLKLEAIIDCCNEVCKQDDMETQERTSPYVTRSVSLLSGKSLSEAQLTLRKACKELDDICISNNWMLPAYHTSASDDGVVANVTVKGSNFECSAKSGVQPSIHEAKNSAATLMIKTLHQMASDLNTTLL